MNHRKWEAEAAVSASRRLLVQPFINDVPEARRWFAMMPTLPGTEGHVVLNRSREFDRAGTPYGRCQC